ncbi:MAG: hypothetical protein WCC69_11060 [Pirellulales bacterium]
MTDRLDPHLAAIEQRLERASLQTATPDLRRRVLASVADVLHENVHEKEKVPATKSGWLEGGGLLSSPDVVAGTFFLAATAAVLWLVVGSPPLPFAPLTLEDRARIAGVNHELLGVFLADGDVADPRPRSMRASNAPPHPDTLRVIDGHRLLQETL